MANLLKQNVAWNRNNKYDYIILWRKQTDLHFHS